MSEITIPFRKEMVTAILSGKKNCTSRVKKYGKTGDHFFVGGKRFVIDNIAVMGLIEVEHMLYKREGFNSPQEFKEYWCIIHPIAKFDPHHKVYVHFFEESPELDTA